MGRNVAEAATGSREIAANVSDVASAAALTTEDVAHSRAAVASLAAMAHEVRTTVAAFTS